MKKIKLVGATGYGGLGLLELALGHPELQIGAVIATQDAGKKISDVWTYLRGYCDLPIWSPESPEAQNCDAEIVVFATPDGVGQKAAAAEIARGRKVLDYSGDFRFNDASVFAEYAARLGKDPRHHAPELLPRSVYGLTELHRAAIGRADLVGNPGCFAMSCILGLAPAVKRGLLAPDGIICDCKSGVSGAGKKPAATHHYPERYENINAYRLSGHQHVMEIERELSLLAAREIKITFTPQVVPMCRGIMSCLYGRLTAGVTAAQALDAYRDFYADEKFVRVQDTAAGTGDVRGSNRCVITVAPDERAGVFRVISHIDNLVKGQAGSALQNINVMCGYPEDLGLNRVGMHP
ncbi:N-acetyl-gamma-glutamyl-phosphate reductase [Planctomycetales bacterium]|nr:N-acetyl-gamma-glutamyl-phosphate reductase [Planctomycetales bacterium]GHT02603.1 N-acetyl-gamma-glutamyl-phosphate reductase [Planctomycetales bacterium]